MTITCTPKRDQTIPVYPEVKITFDNHVAWIQSESYIPVHDESGVPHLSLCSATANTKEMFISKGIEEITKNMNIMAMDLMGKPLPNDKIKNCIPA